MSIELTQARISNISIKVLFGAFIFFTTISSFVAIYTGVYGGDFISLNMMAVPSDITVSTFEVFLAHLIMILIFTFGNRITIKNKIINVGDNGSMSLHVFFSFIILFAMIVVTFTTTGSIIREGYSNRALSVAFELIQPFYLSIIYFYVYNDCKLKVYKVNAFLFVLSCLLTGFTGYILYALPFMIKYAIEKIGIKAILLLSPLAIISLPLLHMYKFMLKYNMTVIDMLNWLDFEKILAFSRSIIDRFSYVPNIIFIRDNNQYFYEFISKPENNPVFQGYIGSFIEKIFVGKTSGNINLELTSVLMNFNDVNSNSTFSLISYFHVDLLFGFFVIIYSCVLFFILKMLFEMLIGSRRKYIPFLLFAPTYLYLFQGWFWPYMNFIQAAIIFFIMTAILKCFRKRQSFSNHLKMS
ncbi:oligosaccharide repeat unit polymerase [Aeromonas enteropelogenes]|uniref:oligosaccharide repeat unit polymerase n=1 Tax=Aeromonas enteropelogenes TaxID=29489 RepID=UPI00398974D8